MRCRLVGLAIASFAICLGCDGEQPGQTTLHLSAADNSRRVSAAVGQTLLISLDSIGMGQFDTPTISSKAVQFIGMIPPDVVTPGGARQIFHFVAASPGSATVAMKHLQPPGLSPEPPFQVIIDVKEQ